MDVVYQICKAQIRKLVSLESLKQLRLSREELDGCIIRIVSRNLTSGRVKYVIERSETCISASENSFPTEDQPQSKKKEPSSLNTQFLVPYVNRVITTYLKEHDRVECLESGDTAAWEQLFEQLTNRAYYALSRQQISTTKAREEAVDFAQETCYAIFNSYFPYDVPFDAWATKILNNTILQRFTRSRDLIDRRPTAVTSLDHPDYPSGLDNDFSLYDLLANEVDVSAFKRIEVQEWLIQAILCLRSQAQQHVIIYTYFYDLSDEEIAKRLDKSSNAIYILRHRALRRLQEILA